MTPSRRYGESSADAAGRPCVGRRLARWVGVFALLTSVAVFPLHAASKRSAPAVQRISVTDFARYFGLDTHWIVPHKKLELKSQWTNLVIEDGSREISLNGVRVFLGDPVVSEHGRLYLGKIDSDVLLGPLLRSQNLPPIGPIRKIAIDPGHGGKDTGTRNIAKKLEEKNFTLDVAKRLQPLLEARGYQVLMTRTDDTFIPLDQRPKMANDFGADLFISIHFNAAGDASVNGSETYILTPQYQRSTGSDEAHPEDAVALSGNRFDGWNAVLGYGTQQDLLQHLGSFDRGMKHARFAVLRDLKCPGMLVEAAYLSNPSGSAKLVTEAFRNRLAETLADAVDDFAHTVDRVRAVRKK